MDGVYLNTTRSGAAARHITLLQSGRASVAVMCPTAGVYYLQTATTFDTASPYHSIGDFTTKSSQNLLILNIDGISYVMSAPPADQSSILRPANLLSSSGAVTGGATTAVGKISVSTAQGGCCGLSTITRTTSNVLLRSNANNSDTNPCGAQYWFGLGADCKPACYGKFLCSALQSVLSTTQVDHIYDGDSYSVYSFPTVRNGNCDYRSFAGYVNQSTQYGSSSQCPALAPHNDAQIIALSRQYAPSAALSSSTAPTIATLGEVQEITLWGHADFAYPIFVQNNILQVGVFSNVDSSVSNIVDSGEYVLQSAQNSSLYAQVGDFKETWPALTGILVLLLLFDAL